MAITAARHAVKRPPPWTVALPARWFVYTVAPLVWLLISTPAQATAIGTFNWSEHTQDECNAGLCGVFFSVDNFSTDPDISLGALGDTFFNVSVNLQTDGAAKSLPLGDIAPGDSSQSIENLSLTNIASAGLTLIFGQPGSIQLLDAFSTQVTELTGPGSLLIDYVASGPPSSVPEPSTLALLIGGLSVLARARRVRPKRLGVRPADPL